MTPRVSSKQQTEILVKSSRVSFKSMTAVRTALLGIWTQAKELPLQQQVGKATKTPNAAQTISASRWVQGLSLRWSSRTLSRGPEI